MFGQTLFFLVVFTHLAWSSNHCDMNSVDFQRAFGACNVELEELYSGDFYHEFLGSPDSDELDVLCSTYQRWLTCLRSLAATCNLSEQQAVNGPGTTHQLIIETCQHRKQRMVHSLHCLMSQSPDINPLYKGCQVLMDTKHEAAIYDTCSIAREYIDCEDRLMRSACGSDLADFSLAISLRHKFTQLNIRAECVYVPTPSYNGFVYSMRCPPDFPVRMRKCYDQFLRVRVALYSSMLAVIRGPEENIEDWCNAFHGYEDCLSPMASACPEGIEAVYETETEWHRIVKVATYLCNEGLGEYTRSLPCYRQMVHQSTIFSLCKSVFEKYPTKFEAYAIKCTPHTYSSRESLRCFMSEDVKHRYTSTQHMANRTEPAHVRKRSKLIECFTSFIRRDCGANASLAIQPLIHMQYSFEFLPPCSTHTTTMCQLISSISSSQHHLIAHLTAYILLPTLLHLNHLT